jgi:hypothetical protein
MEAFYSNSWPSTQGTITLSQIDSYQTQSSMGPGTSTPSQTTMFHPQVSYDYSVGGRDYHSDLINLADNSYSDAHTAEKMLAPYPKGKGVSVYYDPGQPEKAVLEPGPTPSLLIPLFVGAAVSGVGIVLTLLLFRKMFSGWSTAQRK